MVKPMNKSKRMAILKHRQRKKKLKERRKAIAIATGVSIIAPKTTQPRIVEIAKPAPLVEAKKKVAKKAKEKAETASAEVAHPKKVAKKETAVETKLKISKKKKVEEATSAEVTAEAKKKTSKKKSAE